MKISKKDVDSINKIRLEFFSNFKNVPCCKRLKLPRNGGILAKKQKEAICKRWKIKDYKDDMRWSPSFFATNDSLRVKFSKNKEWDGYCIIEPNCGETKFTEKQLEQIRLITKKIVWSIVNDWKPKKEENEEK
jgi:hypothetical protein